ncbi:hypothetical protein P7K49_016889 [Saguinus oedipus]|uniref:small monomeric GTPase n=1 Tax=Saguinus oedipus TaxID=9490 RepID=A0ABQ9VDE4_SAGOE|nr:hypothetical protein P7K49_016889 [Saguinus oedipus]
MVEVDFKERDEVCSQGLGVSICNSQQGQAPLRPQATQIKTYSWDNAQVILVGNKCDMEEERVVPTEKGRLLAEQLALLIPSASLYSQTLCMGNSQLLRILINELRKRLPSGPTNEDYSRNLTISNTLPVPPQTLPFAIRQSNNGESIFVMFIKEKQYAGGSLKLRFDFFEASAKENISVRQAFERLVDAICDKMSDSMDTDPSMLGSSKNTRLSDTPPLLQQNCSC